MNRPKEAEGRRGKRRINLSLQAGIIEWAESLVRARHYGSISVLIEELIRERYDSVFGHAAPGTRYPSHQDQAALVEDKAATPKKTKAA